MALSPCLRTHLGGHGSHGAGNLRWLHAVRVPRQLHSKHQGRLCQLARHLAQLATAACAGAGGGRVSAGARESRSPRPTPRARERVGSAPPHPCPCRTACSPGSPSKAARPWTGQGSRRGGPEWRQPAAGRGVVCFVGELRGGLPFKCAAMQGDHSSVHNVHSAHVDCVHKLCEVVIVGGQAARDAAQRLTAGVGEPRRRQSRAA